MPLSAILWGLFQSNKLYISWILEILLLLVRNSIIRMIIFFLLYLKIQRKSILKNWSCQYVVEISWIVCDNLQLMRTWRTRKWHDFVKIAIYCSYFSLFPVWEIWKPLSNLNCKAKNGSKWHSSFFKIVKWNWKDDSSKENSAHFSIVH